jgi:hypothetical protein
MKSLIDFYWSDAPIGARIVVVFFLICFGTGAGANLLILLLTIIAPTCDNPMPCVPGKYGPQPCVSRCR